MSSQNNYCVYKHTCPNGKVYIGITCKNPLYRWNHGNGYKSNSHFYNAIVKYGWDNIKHEILFDGLTKEEAEQKEKVLIAKVDIGHICRCCKGGSKTAGGFIWSYVK